MSKPKVRWKRLSTTATTPRKGYPGDAAYDLFADHRAIIGNRATLIQTNIAAAIPEGYGGLLLGRSKLATKSITPLAFVLTDESGRLRLGGVIDPSYRGPIGFIVASIGLTGNETVNAGDAVAQMWILPVPDLDDEDVGDGDLPPGIRGERGYGSTDPHRPPVITGPEDWQMSRAEMEGKEHPEVLSIPSLWAGPTTRFDREQFERLYRGTFPQAKPEYPPVDIGGVNAPPPVMFKNKWSDSWANQMVPEPFPDPVPFAARPLENLSLIRGHRPEPPDEVGEYLRNVLDQFQNGSPVIIAPGARVETVGDYRGRVAKACDLAAVECWASEGPENPELGPGAYDRAMEAGFAEIIRSHVLPALEIPEPPTPIVAPTPTPDPGTPPDLE